MGRYLLGEFEHLVLLTTIKLRDDAYGVSIARELSEQTGKDVAQAAVYLTLRRLEEKGWVQGNVGETSAKRDGRVKRYFRVTPEGLTRIQESRNTLQAIWSQIGDQLS